MGLCPELPGPPAWGTGGRVMTSTLPPCRLRSPRALCPNRGGLRLSAGHLAVAGEPASWRGPHLRGLPHRPFLGPLGCSLFRDVSIRARPIPLLQKAEPDQQLDPADSRLT